MWVNSVVMAVIFCDHCDYMVLPRWLWREPDFKLTTTTVAQAIDVNHLRMVSTEYLDEDGVLG